MPNFTPHIDIRQMYDRFDTPVTGVDCGTQCAPHNPSGKPFCCDICHAIPAAYHQEWEYLQQQTSLWQVWRGDECPGDAVDPAELRSQTPEHMTLLACLGPAHCQRAYRAMSCRQFPFFPYISTGYRFIGLAYEWEFEQTCWVISHLGEVTAAYRDEFVRIYAEMFAQWPDEFTSYAVMSEQMRERFAIRKWRIPILHRNGGLYLLSPDSERMQPVSVQRLRRFGPYQK